MDETIARWILEYLLRQRLDENFMDDLLSIIPIPNDDVPLEKAMLLRKIEFEISNSLVSEKILDLIESIEEIECKTASNSMKSAYCLVAVDCTVKFLETKKNEKYIDAIKKIWKDRVFVNEGLISVESKRWFGEIEAAICDSEVCERILMRNMRNEALKAVRVYLREAWKCVGPTFLQLVAEKFSGAAADKFAKAAVKCGGEGDGDGSDPLSDVVVEIMKSNNNFSVKKIAKKADTVGEVSGEKVAENAELETRDVGGEKVVENNESETRDVSGKKVDENPKLVTVRDVNEGTSSKSKRKLKDYSNLKNDDGLVSGRRVRKIWTPMEEDVLREGVKKFGKGNWKFILQAYSDEFKGRTEVNLKDKWRNMIRSPY